jgi:glycosyltransferase involved in cell wall biosynthesis
MDGMASSADRQTKRVLAIDPFHGGSHRHFIDNVGKHSRLVWHVIPGKPVHWKWRMRSAPLEMADKTRRWIDAHGYPDAVFCTDMLDLPLWRGLLRDPAMQTIPAMVYFHENQFTYPQAPEAREDFHYGYTNLTTAIAADACVFNSSFHQADFLSAAGRFLARMPDARSFHDLDELRRRSRVIPPGFEPPAIEPPAIDRRSPEHESEPLRIGWVSRWEHDKRPDRLVDLCGRLKTAGLDYRLILLGNRPIKRNPWHAKLVDRFSAVTLQDGYASSRRQYWEWLARMDVVVSTADHEFFGMAICEATWAGAVPVLPNRLSYPELIPASCLYDDLDQAAAQITALRDRGRRRCQSQKCVEQITSLRAAEVTDRLDDAIRAMIHQAKAVATR